VLRLVPFFFCERRGMRRFRLSTYLFVYICVILLIFLFSGLAMMVENIFNDNMDNVYTFAAMIKVLHT